MCALVLGAARACPCVRHGSPPLCHSQLLDEVRRGDCEAVEVRLRKGTRVNFFDADGRSPLRVACAHADPQLALQLVQTLLDSGAAADEAAPAGEPGALEWAIERGCPRMVHRPPPRTRPHPSAWSLDGRHRPHKKRVHGSRQVGMLLAHGALPRVAWQGGYSVTDYSREAVRQARTRTLALAAPARCIP